MIRGLVRHHFHPMGHNLVLNKQFRHVAAGCLLIDKQMDKPAMLLFQRRMDRIHRCGILTAS